MDSKTLLDWLIPSLLGALITVGGGVCAVLWTISDRLSGINTSLAVAVSRVEDHERRLTNLETLFLHPRP